jgi:peptide/nickel transport system substrate-binding protein
MSVKKRNYLQSIRRYVLPSERAWHAETHEYMPELCDQLARGTIHRRDFLRQACLLGVSAASAYSLAGVLSGEPFVRQAVAATPKKGGRLKVSMRVQETTDPARFDWVEKSNVSRFLVEHLVRTQADNVTVPYLAEGWEASDDLTSWVFRLQKGIKWSNGDEFTSEDVAHNVTRWLDPATGSSNLGLFGVMVEEYDTGEKDENGNAKKAKRMVDGAVEVIDKHTIKFNLRQPALAIPENFYNYPTAIVHRGFGKDYEADISKNPIGTGACELVKFNVGEGALLRNTGTWWAGDFHLDEVEYIDHGEDTNAHIAALVSKQVDMIFRVPIESLDTIKRVPHLELAPATTAQTALMRFRTSEKPFDNKKLRQAIAACMDHAEINRIAFQDNGVVAENHHVAPIHPEYAKLPPLKRDVELAKKLLAEAGYADGITLEIANGDTEGAWMTAACSIFKQQCAPAGITVNINKMPSSQYWEIWDKAPWGYTGWTHRPLGTMVLSLAYRSGVPWNECAYNNPDFDKALDAAEAELDINERKKKMEVCEKILQDDAIIPQPFWRTVNKAHDKRVKGHITHPTFYHQFHNVWLDDA